MDTVSAYFAHYGLLAVFGVVFAKQLGAPLPSTLVLVLAGAAAAHDALFGAEALLVATVASTLASLAWFHAGRRFGRRVLALVCRLSLSPDSCVRRNELSFARRGAATLVLAKLIPGLGAVAPPMAGALGMPVRSFVFFSAAGAALWAALGLAGGVLFHREILALLARLADLGRMAVWPIVGVLALYVLFRLAWRWRELRLHARIPRVRPAELAAMLQAGLEPLVVDVRARGAQSLPRIPGARSVELGEIEAAPFADWLGAGPVVVYCDCPNDVSASRAAALLARRGIPASVLLGGMDGWVQAGYSLADD